MPAITQIRPIPRNQGIQVPGLLAAAQWVDTLALSANTAKSYTLPVDADGNKGTVLGISATTGPLYVNFGGAAVVASVDVTDGTGSAILRTDLASYLVFVPGGTTAVSFICGATCKVTLEVWN